MTNLEIKINIPMILQNNQLLMKEISKESMMKLIESFSRYIASLYIRLLEDAIYSNRYKGKWEPVEDENYRKYIGTEPIGDILPIIRDSLEVKKIGYNFLIRIDNTIKYPGSKLSLLRVVRAIDSGTTKFNARPVFSHIIIFLNHNIYNLWRGYLLKRRIV